jgi:hypothetical protein
MFKGEESGNARRGFTKSYYRYRFLILLGCALLQVGMTCDTIFKTMKNVEFLTYITVF